MEKKVSIKDIARKLGISISTVSFVVNGKAKEKRISEALTKKVLQLVEELGYKPDALAKSFRTGKTNIIGFVVDDISQPFFSGIARYIDEKASQKGYKIIYSSTRNSKGTAIELLKIFEDRHVDGYIIALPEGLEEEVKSLVLSSKPVVLFDRYFPGIETDYVVITNQESMYKATRHLLSNGYKNVGFVTIDTIEQQMIDRLEGYKQAILEAKLSEHILKIQYSGSSDSIDQISAYLKQEHDLDAIIFSTNYLCMDGLRSVRKLGLKIPDDFAVVSFDDFELLEFSDPTVTAIAQPLEAIAENIIDILMLRLEKPNADRAHHKVILPAVLNIRNSSLPKS